MSRKTALQILESGTTDEAQLKRAELYLYADRTQALAPDPVIKEVEKVYLIEEKTGGGDWKAKQVFTDERLAAETLHSLQVAATISNGYWEVRVRVFTVTTS
jgi:hypothetical protein